jgi:Mce-associated membrane protein
VTEDVRDVKTTETAETALAVEIDSAASEATTEATTASPAQTKCLRGGLRRVLCNKKLVPVILVLLLLISGGVATWLYFKQYRPGQQTDPRVARAVVNAASDGTAALLSYSPDTLDKASPPPGRTSSGISCPNYNQLTQQIVTPAAKQKSLKITAHLMDAAVSQLRPDSAVVLVLGDQSTTSKDSPDPSMTASSVLVSMTRVNGDWLISKLDPVWQLRLAVLLHSERAAQRLSVQGPVLPGDNPIRHHRVKAVECRCDNVQFGVDIGVQEPIGIVDGFVTAWVDLGAADERGRQTL